MWLWGLRAESRVSSEGKADEECISIIDCLYSVCYSSYCTVLLTWFVAYLSVFSTACIAIVCDICVHFSLSVFITFLQLCKSCSFSSALFISHPSFEGWPHHGRPFSIYLCPLSFWLTVPRRFLSTYWCCPSRSCVVLLACVHLALFLALSLSPDISLVFSWCDHSMLASLLWQCLTVPHTLALLRTHSFVFFAVHETRRIFLSPFISKASRRVSQCPAFTAVHCCRPH